jgi:hypothetical protein
MLIVENPRQADKINIAFASYLECIHDSADDQTLCGLGRPLRMAQSDQLEPSQTNEDYLNTDNTVEMKAKCKAYLGAWLERRISHSAENSCLEAHNPIQPGEPGMIHVHSQKQNKY